LPKLGEVTFCGVSAVSLEFSPLRPLSKCQVGTFIPDGGGGGGGSLGGVVPVEPPHPVLTITHTRVINKTINSREGKERERAAIFNYSSPLDHGAILSSQIMLWGCFRRKDWGT
jgi:hypothetical protein